MNKLIKGALIFLLSPMAIADEPYKYPLVLEGPSITVRTGAAWEKYLQDDVYVRTTPANGAFSVAQVDTQTTDSTLMYRADPNNPLARRIREMGIQGDGAQPANAVGSVATPANSQNRLQAQQGEQIDWVKRETTLVFLPESSLKENLERWAVINGLRLQWEPSVDMEIVATAELTAAMEDIPEKLNEWFLQANKRFSVTLHSNRVLKVDYYGRG